MYGYEQQVMSIIGTGNPRTAIVAAEDAAGDAYVGSYSGPCDSLDELHAMQAMRTDEEDRAFNMQEDARIEALINDDPFVPVTPAVEPLTNDDILAGVDQFLSPFVRAEIEKAIAPLVAAANKAPETVFVEVEKVVEKIVEVPAAPQAPEGQLPFATRAGTAALGSLFGFEGEGEDTQVTMVESFGAAPAMDPYYVADPVNIRVMATAFERGANVWAFGPGGSGKTSMPKEIAARTGRPYVKISFSRNSHADDMIGGKGMENGSTQWEDGVLIAAMKRPYTVIAFDEVSLATAGVQGILQGVTDSHRTYFLPNGEKVIAAPGVCFVVCDNTAGRGDDTGLYAGTNPSNAALVDRFDRMIRVDYIAVELEARALANHTGAPLEAATHVAEFAARARRMPEMQAMVLSLRGLTAFVNMVSDGFNVDQAAEATILNKLADTERAAMETFFTLAWKQDFVNLLRGQMPQPPVQPSNSYAARAFDDETSALLAR